MGATAGSALTAQKVAPVCFDGSRSENILGQSIAFGTSFFEVLHLCYLLPPNLGYIKTGALLPRTHLRLEIE